MQVGSRRIKVRARVADATERKRLWSEVVKTHTLPAIRVTPQDPRLGRPTDDRDGHRQLVRSARAPAGSCMRSDRGAGLGGPLRAGVSSSRLRGHPAPGFRSHAEPGLCSRRANHGARPYLPGLQDTGALADDAGQQARPSAGRGSGSPHLHAHHAQGAVLAGASRSLDAVPRSNHPRARRARCGTCSAGSRRGSRERGGRRRARAARAAGETRTPAVAGLGGTCAGELQLAAGDAGNGWGARGRAFPHRQAGRDAPACGGPGARALAARARHHAGSAGQLGLHLAEAAEALQRTVGAGAREGRGSAGAAERPRNRAGERAPRDLGDVLGAAVPRQPWNGRRAQQQTRADGSRRRRLHQRPRPVRRAHGHVQGLLGARRRPSGERRRC